MEASELLAAIETDPTNTQPFEDAIDDAISEGPEALDALLSDIVSQLSEGPVAEASQKVLDHRFRKNRESEFGPVLAWHAGVITWKVQDDRVRAEFFMRAIDGGGQHASDWQEFYRQFYASRGNWLRLEQFMNDAGQRENKSALDIRRDLARTAHEFDNAGKELSYWQSVAKEAPGDDEADSQLESLLTRLERWPSLANLLKARVDRLSDDAVEEKTALLQEMIKICGDKMRAEPKVLATYQQILDIDPGNDSAIDSLLSRYESSGRWPDYAKVLKRKIENTEDRDELIGLRRTQADLMETRFSNAMEAVKAYEAILELVPDDSDVIDKLKDLYEKRRDFENLIRIRMIEADGEEDPELKIAILVELAALATERLRKVPVAVKMWETVLEIDDSNPDALINLESLYERDKKLDKLCTILAKRVELVESDEERIPILEKQAQIQGTRLDDSAGALETWKQILKIRPDHERAKRELRARFLSDGCWDDLEWFLREYGTVDELARTLESQVGSIQDVDDKRGILFKLAAIWRDEINQPIRAVKDLEAVLADDSENLRAATELIDLYKGLSDYKRLPRVYDVVIAGVEGEARRLELMIEAAELHEKRLRNLDRAFFLYVDAFKEDMGNLDIWGELERLAGPSQNWDTYVAVLEQAAAIMGEDGRKIETYLRVGEIHSKELHQPDEALKAYRSVLNLEPENAQAISSLESIYRETGDNQALVDILRKRLGLEDVVEECRNIRYEIASVLYARLHNVDESITVYEEILSDAPEETRAHEELSEILLDERRFEGLAEVLKRQVELFSGLPEVSSDLMADLHCRIGVLSFGLQGPTLDAVDSWSRALGFVPEHATTIEMLEGVLGIDDLRLAAVSLLKEPYRTLNRWPDLADAMEIELSERGDIEPTVGLLWELNELYDGKVADDTKRFRTLSRILNVTPGNIEAWDLIEQVAGAIDSWRDLTGLFKDTIEVLDNIDKQVLLNLKLARIYLDRLQDTEEARRIFHDVLESDGENEEALEALETIYESLEDHEELLKVYRRRFEVSEYTGEKMAYAFKMASELAEHLDDIEGAIDSIMLVLDMDPEYSPAYRELDGFYTRAERWVDLAGALRERIRLAEEDDDRTYLRLRLAKVLEDNLEDLDGAVDVYKTILDGDPGHDVSVEQLERLFENEDVRVQIAPILLPAYEQRQDHHRQVECWDVVARAESDLDRKISCHETIAGIYENEINDLDKAFEYRAMAYRTAPHREDLVDQVLRVGEARSETEEAVLVLCEKVFDIEDEARRLETHRTVAHICIDANIDRDLAKRHYNEVLVLDPDDLDALDSLIAIYKDDDEPEPLVGLLHRKADLVQESTERTNLLLWAGELLAEKLDESDEAIRTYSAVLEIDNSNGQAMTALEGLYEGAGHWEDLVEILTNKADFADGIPDKVAALSKKGEVLHEKLENVAEAVETYLQVRELDPADLDTLRTLDRLYMEQEDWLNVFEVLGSLFGVLDGDEKAKVQFRMGRLLESELGDPSRAVGTYSEILDDRPGDGDTLDALEGMVRSDEAAAEAFQVLGPALSDNGQWERLFVVYDVTTEREEDPARKVANLLTMGEIAQSRLEEPIRAFECYGRAFTADPLNEEALEKIESLADEYDMWDGVPPLLFEGAAGIEGMSESLDLRMKAAGIRRDRLDDKEGAAKNYEAVITDAPDNSYALSSLNDLYADLERFEDQARILQMQIDAESEVDKKIDFMLKLGDVSEDRLGSNKAALEARREALYLSPGHIGAVQALRSMFDADKERFEVLELLEPIYRDGESWDDLADIYEATIPSIEDLFERKTVLLKLADVCLDNLDRKMSAIGWLGNAMSIEPDDEGLLVRIEQLAEESEAWQSLKSILSEAAAGCEDDDRRIYLWHKAAICARDRLDDIESTESIFKGILEVNEADRDSLAALDAMYVSGERWDELLSILKVECDAAEYDDEKTAFLLRAGALQRDRLDDDDGAIESFKAVLDSDETDKDALNALVELHDSRTEYPELFSTLSTLSDVTASDTDRAGILRRMASIAEERLERSDDALSLWEEITRLDPNDAASLAELERLYAGKGDWTAFVDACEREIPLVSDDSERVVELLRQVAKAAQDELNDAYMAQHAWKRILDSDGSDIEAMQALRMLYRENGDLESLSEILGSLAGSGAFDGDEIKALYEEHALLLTEELHKPEGAIDLWGLVLATDPDHERALASLDGLYEETGAFGQCVEIVKKRVSLMEDTDLKVEALTRAADLQSDRMEDLGAAAATLEEILEFSKENTDVFDRLQMLYTRMEDWDRLGDLLLRLDDILEDVDDRVRNLSELARIFEDRKGDKAGAFLIAVKSAQVNPSDEMVLAEVWRITQDIENWTDYVSSLVPIVDKMPDMQTEEHLVRFGECMWKRAEQPEEAVQYYERAVEASPENELALEALTDLYTSLGSHEDLVSVLYKRKELTPDYLEKVRLLLVAGTVLETDIGDGERALESYKAVIEFDDANMEALDHMAGLHESREEWEDLLKVLDAIAPIDLDREVETRLRMGEVIENRIKDTERAISVYEDVLSVEPTQEKALDRLQALYGEQNNWQGLAQVFDRLLDYAANDPDRILFCGRLGLLYEEALEDKAGALEYYQRILDMDPDDDEVFETCLRLFTEIEEWMDMVNLLESRVSRSEDVEVKVTTLERIAHTYEDRMEDINAAISSRQRIVEIEEGHVQSYNELARLFGLMETWEDVVATIMRWKEYVEEPEFIALMLRAATIVKERLENPDRALKLLGDVLRVDPLNEAAADKMRLIYADFEDWEKVAGVYLQQEDHVEEDEDKARLRAQAAEVYLDRLKDRKSAVEHFEKALQLNPRMRDVSLSLARAYVAAEQWEKAIPLLDLQLSETDADAEVDRAAEIHYQLGLCAERLFDQDKAFREFQTASKLRPDHPTIVTGLARLYRQKELWQLSKDHFEKALELSAQDVEGGLDEDELVDVTYALGEVSVELGDFDAAIGYLDRVQEARPNLSKASELAVTIAEKSGDWASVIKYKQALLQSQPDPFQKFAVLLEIGDIYKEKLENTYGAISTYKEALEVDQDAKAALLRLLDIYLEDDATEDALFMLDRLADTEESPEKKALNYIRIAALYQEKMADEAKAIEYLNMALDSDPNRLEAFRAIDEILTNNKDWETQAENYRKMVDRIKDGSNPDLEFRLYQNLGEIYRSRLKEIDYAISAYSKATQVKPDDVKSHEILAQLYEFTGDQLDKAVDAHRAIVSADPFDANAAASYKAMRRLYLEMKDLDKAFVTSSALVAAGYADEDELKFYEGNLDPSLPWFKGTLDQLRWESHLQSEVEYPLLGHILQSLYQGIGTELGPRDLKDLGLKKKNELDLGEKLLFVNVYKAVLKAIGGLKHKVYRDDGSIGMRIEFLPTPGLIVGADMLTGLGEREAAFMIGRQLAFLHPMHFLAAVKNLTELKVLLAAVLKFSNPKTQVSTGADVVTELVKIIEKRMPQQHQNKIAKLSADLLERHPDTDVGTMFNEFFIGVERTALRSGVLACGSVVTALDVLRSEDAGFSEMTQKERMKEVIRFGVSEDHFVLRRALGIAVETEV